MSLLKNKIKYQAPVSIKDEISAPSRSNETSLEAILNSVRTNKHIDTPYSLNISAGKNTYVYDAHTYHTKVPPQGIATIINYYTNPGEIILDPFCGSGMTGVAALENGRKAILSDLSPAAIFIAENLCTPIDDTEYMAAVDKIINESKLLEDQLYKTTCRDCGKPTTLLYTVWSYGLVCSNCNHEFILWDVARDERDSVKESKIKKEFPCPHCGETIAKRNLKRTKRYPVQVGYKCCAKGSKDQTAEPNADDLEIINQLENQKIPEDLWYPTNSFPLGVNTKQPIAAGITSVDKAYTPRALRAMAYLWNKASRHPDIAVQNKLKFAVTSLYQRVTIFSEFRFWGGSGNIANFNVPQIMNEQNVFKAFYRKAKTISWYFRDAPRINRHLHASVQSACNLNHLPDESIDFIFTDPPFGSNINYSEMNFLWESWLGTYTDNTEEAIVNKAQNKNVDDYQVLLCRAFLEANRVLRKDGWMCVVFHNSSEKVWKALQGAIADAGFTVVAAQTFDKQHGTFKMFVSDNAVGYDLVLHCKKHSRENNIPIILTQASAQAVRDFVLKKLELEDSYQVHYLHVVRKTEFDYRRIYAEWLCNSFAKNEISLDFESFRAIVDDVRKKNND